MISQWNTSNALPKYAAIKIIMQNIGIIKDVKMLSKTNCNSASQVW